MADKYETDVLTAKYRKPGLWTPLQIDWMVHFEQHTGFEVIGFDDHGSGDTFYDIQHSNYQWVCDVAWEAFEYNKKELDEEGVTHE